MPVFRGGPVYVDPRFDGETLGALRDAGHGRRLNVVDRSYDVPDGERRVRFPGSSADALFGIARLIPIEGDKATMMWPDPEARKRKDYIAAGKFEDVVARLVSQDGYPIPLEFEKRYKDDSDEIAAAGRPGFYSLANAGEENRLYVVTTDPLPFACASLVVGHSQRVSQYA